MLDRRDLLKTLSAVGIGTAVFHRSLAALFSQDEISLDSIKQAEWITGLELEDEQRVEILKSVQRATAGFADLRKVKLTADVPMAIHFAPTANHETIKTVAREAKPIESDAIELPEKDEDIAFLPVHRLARLIESKKLHATKNARVACGRSVRQNDIIIPFYIVVTIQWKFVTSTTHGCAIIWL